MAAEPPSQIEEARKAALAAIDIPDVDDDIKNEEVVVLLQGNNVFGDAIYSYIKLTLGKFRDLALAMRDDVDFKPADFGSVLAAGRGTPSKELRSEMAVTYKLMDVPQPKQDTPDVKMPKFAAGDSDS